MSLRILILLVVVAATFSDAEGNIENVAFNKLGSYNSDDHFEMTYYLPRYFTTEWQNARSICQSYGMEFLTLETEAEANNFLKICKHHQEAFETFVHIGGIAAQGKSKDKWYWVTTGEKVSYPLKWAPGEPNNAHQGNEFCLSLVKYSGGDFTFNDIQCKYEVQKFLCKRRTYKAVTK